MGLRDLKKAAREKEFEEYLLSYGITKADLCNLHEIIAKVKNFKPEPVYKPSTFSKEEKEKLLEEQRKKMTPEQLVESFAGESEEFYENGRKPKKNNN